MSMTRSDIICQSCAHSKVCKFNDGESSEYCNQHLALTALRPVSREQVERIWFREPYTRLGTKYGENGDIVYSAVNTCMACGHETPIGHFCHNCGAALDHMGVQVVVERLEALHEISPST